VLFSPRYAAKLAKSQAMSPTGLSVCSVRIPKSKTKRRRKLELMLKFSETEITGVPFFKTQNKSKIKFLGLRFRSFWRSVAQYVGTGSTELSCCYRLGTEARGKK